jgi:hypothetical protein
MNKLKLFFLFSITFSLVIKSYAEDPQIIEIKKEFQSIKNTISSLKQETKNLNEFGYSTEGGEAKIYRDLKNNVRLIKVIFFGEMGKSVKEFYFQNNLLFYSYHEDHRYNVPMYLINRKDGGETFDPKKTQIFEHRYYFNNLKMIRWIDSGKKEVVLQSAEFNSKEKEILDFINELQSKIIYKK